MYLKRLEMIGFKSFPEKIRLEFNTGITAVVGPNGSGKSNVSDAIRWVLGEQSAKSLRGTKMEDVIFAGTANRKPLGYAEVTMTVDNTDRGLKTDYAEVSVTRRVYRSGESEYSLNGVSCRMKDIHELFMDTGIGKEGYSIIGQGRIEEVLSSKSEERRLLFEEAAGIVKYKARRFEALSKLEREKANLERVTDIINEIESALEPLGEQSEKARKYLKLAEELKLIQMNIFIQEVESAQERIDKLDNSIRIVLEQALSCEADKRECDESIIRFKEELELLEKNQHEISAKAAENRSAYEQTENDIILKQEQIQHLISDIDSIKQRISEKSSDFENNKLELDRQSEQLSNISQEIEQKHKLLTEKDLDFKGFSELMSEEELATGRINSQIIEIMQSLSETSNDISRSENYYEQLQVRMESIKEDLSALNMELSHEIDEQKTLSGHLSSFDEKSLRLDDNLNELALEREDLSRKLSECKDLIRACSQKLHEAKYRTKMLSELESSFEGYQKPVKRLLSYNKEHPRELTGIIGAVGELLSVEKKYETAIEISLGASLQNIVTENENDARCAIDYLKKTGAGRATFLPLTTIKARSFTVNSALLKEPGVLGIAFNLCSFDERFSQIFQSLLSGVVVIDSIDTAIKLSKKYNYSYKLVTLEGDLFNPGGSITGGSVSVKASGIFGRKREIQALTAEISQLSSDESSLNNKIQNIKRQLDAVDFQREQSLKARQAIEVEKSAATERFGQLSKSISQSNERIEALNVENDQIMKQIIEINTQIRTLELLKNERENDLKNTKTELNRLNELITAKRTEKDSRYAEITELKIEVTILEEKITGIESKINELTNSSALNTGSIEKLKTDIDKKEQGLAIKHDEVNLLQEQKESLFDEQNRLRSVLEDFGSKLALKKEDLENLEEEGVNLLESLSKLQGESSRLELQKEHINENLRRIYDAMWEEYEITYQQARNAVRLDKTLNKLSSEERAIKTAIRELGSVNVGAIEEYKLLSERHSFLTKQALDIQEAEAQLKEIIEQLTQLMENQFKEHFAIISDNFASVFSDIFGGGTASLKLADGENVLESGIDIIAKPPGKALQSLSLLSGGERALTATALLFAILRMKPSPFCILDEIESALDDANVVRYVNYLQNFCKDTQFILITHRKSVMEAAGVLYGITMQEQGVSALVSVKFENESA